MPEPGSLSGSSVDQVFAWLRNIVTDLSVERLRVKYVRVDDDDLWFIRSGNGAATEVQLETRAEGNPPFLIEGMTEDQRLLTSDIAEATATIERWLRE